ncbi:hypothetical protein OWM07_00910 [Deferribacter thermophilus]|uniref:hypothetical protein n=1 Tax=Deferribacter thermophilus TaxID=53573 RepID=UPI003C254646
MSIQANNLEATISKVSYELVSEKILDENEINKLLGVLSSNGVYAMWVYALDKLDLSFKENNEKAQILEFLNKFLKLVKVIDKNFSEIDNIKNINNYKEKISNLTKRIKNDTDKERKKSLNIERNRLLRLLLEEANKYLQEISNDLHKLLFLKQLLEKTLIYARYQAKALGD